MKQEKLIIHLNKPSTIVEAYGDVAFALHLDSKLHSGVMVFVRGAIVLAASRKHALLKSPTESKFVALTDGMKSF
jgi:hypothetical protein